MAPPAQGEVGRTGAGVDAGHACRMCGLLFASHELNVAHMLGHLRGYLCMNCGGRFYRGADLLGHMALCDGDAASAEPSAGPPPPATPWPRERPTGPARPVVGFIEQVDLVSESDSGHEDNDDDQAAGRPVVGPASPEGSGDEDRIPVVRELGPGPRPEGASPTVDEAVNLDQGAATATSLEAVSDPLAEGRRRQSEPLVAVEAISVKPGPRAKKVDASRLSCPESIKKWPASLPKPRAPVPGRLTISSRPAPASRKRRLAVRPSETSNSPLQPKQDT